MVAWCECTRTVFCSHARQCSGSGVGPRPAVAVPRLMLMLPPVDAHAMNCSCDTPSGTARSYLASTHRMLSKPRAATSTIRSSSTSSEWPMNCERAYLPRSPRPRCRKLAPLSRRYGTIGSPCSKPSACLCWSKATTRSTYATAVGTARSAHCCMRINPPSQSSPAAAT